MEAGNRDYAGASCANRIRAKRGCMEQSFNPGVYVEKRPGKYGDVEVSVKLTKDAIASVEVT